MPDPVRDLTLAGAAALAVLGFLRGIVRVGYLVDQQLKELRDQVVQLRLERDQWMARSFESDRRADTAIEVTRAALQKAGIIPPPAP